jgi:general secretion pathway protein K
VKSLGRRGVALIFVLWLLVLLGVIVAEVASRSRLEADILSNLRARTVARSGAESGIVAAVVRIEALLDSTRSLPERITTFRDLNARLAPLDDVALGSGRFGVTVVDLNARIDLNRADAVTLQGLFRQFTSDAHAEEVAALVKQAPLNRLGELTYIPEVDDSLALAVAPYITLWSDGSVNINSAPEPVLAALPGISSAMARSAVRRRETGEVFIMPTGPSGLLSAIPAGVAGTPAPRLSVMPNSLLIVSRGWQAGHPLTHEIQAVYAVLGPRLVLRARQERDL